MHSGHDLVAAVIAYFSGSVSDKPADRNHHFVHGKVEISAAFLETILLLRTCGWIVYETIVRIDRCEVFVHAEPLMVKHIQSNENEIL